MTLLNVLKRKYPAKVKCKNCNHIQMIQIPKGTKKEEYIIGDDAVCANCGCDSLNLYKDVFSVEQEEKPHKSQKPLKPEGKNRFEQIDVNKTFWGRQ